jgi:hypothetical protein
MTRHVKKCNYKSENATLIEAVKTLTQEVREMKAGTTINNTTINNDNRVLNYNKVVLKPYGQEDLEMLDIEVVKHLLKSNPEKYTHSMIALIHANPDMLEYHNIFYNPLTDEIMTYTKINNQLKWTPKDVDEATVELTCKSKRYLTSHPMAQDIPRGCLDEIELANNMSTAINMDSISSDDVKQTLQKVTENGEFLKMVERQKQNLKSLTV